MRRKIVLRIFYYYTYRLSKYKMFQRKIINTQFYKIIKIVNQKNN